MRLIAGLDVYRPADAVETAECWELSLRNADRPAVIALSRQDVPHCAPYPGLTQRAGAYRVRASTAPRRTVLVATRTEVATAVAAADLLEARSIGVDVVSMPSWRRFDAQSAEYRAALLPRNMLTVSVEAGTTLPSSFI